MHVSLLWVICAPAYNQKIGNAAHSGVFEVLVFTKSYKWKKQRWKKWTTGRILLEIMCFWRSPTVRQFKMADRRTREQQKLKLLDVAWQCPDYSLLFSCSISFTESFATCLRNKVHVYFTFTLLTCPRRGGGGSLPGGCNSFDSWTEKCNMKKGVLWIRPISNGFPISILHSPGGSTPLQCLMHMGMKSRSWKLCYTVPYREKEAEGKN